MKQFILQIPDAAYDFEPDTWERYFRSLQQMVNQMVVGYFKYHVDRNLPLKILTRDSIDKMLFVRQRMCLYDGKGENDACTCGLLGEPQFHEASCFLVSHQEKTNSGNTENLLDAGNGLILEHMFPRHPNGHFKSQSEKDSPGLTYID